MSEPEATGLWPDGHPGDGTLHEGLDGQLPATEAAVVAEHVAHCATCRAQVAVAYGFITATHRILAALVEPAAPSEQKQGPEAARVTSPPPVPQNSLVAVAKLAPLAAANAPLARAPAAFPERPAPTVSPRDSRSGRGSAVAPRYTPIMPSTPVAERRVAGNPFPWKRVAMTVAIVLAGTVGVLVWRNWPASVAATVPEPAPPVVTLPPKSDTSAVVLSEVFDSLVMTRRTCTAQCSEYEVHVSNAGLVRYVEHVSFDQPRVVQDALSTLKQRSISEAISDALFESALVAPTGHMLCTATDSTQRNSVEIVVSRGSTSQTRSTINCKTPALDLQHLAAQIDSLAGTQRLKDLIPHR